MQTDDNFEKASAEIQNFIGQTIAKHRTAKHLTQLQLSERVECSVQHLGAVEQGKTMPSVQLLIRLSMELGVAIRDFFAADESDVESLFQNLSLEAQEFARSMLHQLATYEKRKKGER